MCVLQVQDSSDVIKEGRVRVVFNIPHEPQLELLIQNQHVRNSPTVLVASELNLPVNVSLNTIAPEGSLCGGLKGCGLEPGARAFSRETGSVFVHVDSVFVPMCLL